jgi:hypothetical protein
MQTWATLAAKHAALTSGIGLGAIPAMGWDSLDGVAVGALLAGVGFAVLNSPRRAQNCQLPLMTYESVGQTQASRAPRGRLARVRRRVDGVLTGMLSDDSDRMTPALAIWPDETPEEQLPDEQSPREQSSAGPSAAEEAWPGLDAEHLMAALADAEPAAAGAEPIAHAKPIVPAEPIAPAEPSAPDAEPPAADAEPPAEAASAAAAGSVADAVATARTSDDGFWGPGEPGSSAPTSGYRSKHRLDAPALNAAPVEGGRSGPRHAAPRAGFGAALSRSLTSPRLTSRSAAHAGG